VGEKGDPLFVRVWPRFREGGGPWAGTGPVVDILPERGEDEKDDELLRNAPGVAFAPIGVRGADFR
jgi:hypothetical protein